MMVDEFDFSNQIVELEASRAALLAQLPAAKQARKEAFHALEIAQARWNGIVIRVDRAAEKTGGVLSPALGRLLDDERARYAAAGLELTKTKRHLAQLRWEISCRNSGLEQIDALVNPPPPPLKRDVVVMRTRERVEDVESIVMPPSKERVA